MGVVDAFKVFLHYYCGLYGFGLLVLLQALVLKTI